MISRLLRWENSKQQAIRDQQQETRIVQSELSTTNQLRSRLKLHQFRQSFREPKWARSTSTDLRANQALASTVPIHSNQWCHPQSDSSSDQLYPTKQRSTASKFDQISLSRVQYTPKMKKEHQIKVSAYALSAIVTSRNPATPVTVVRQTKTSLAVLSHPRQA